MERRKSTGSRYFRRLICNFFRDTPARTPWPMQEPSIGTRPSRARARRWLQHTPGSFQVSDRTFLRLEFVFFDAGPSRSLKFPSRRSRARSTRPLLHYPGRTFQGGVRQNVCKIGCRNGAKSDIWFRTVGVYSVMLSQLRRTNPLDRRAYQACALTT